jgi:hypothetical protein
MSAAGQKALLGPSLRQAVRYIGCFAEDQTRSIPEMSARGRGARLAVGLGFLAVAASPVCRKNPRLLVRWPTTLALSWFGISHAVASASGYHGCPELGAVASIGLRRQIATNCLIWTQIDRAIGAGHASGRKG